MTSRPPEKVLGDLLDAADAAGELVRRGRAAFDTDRLLRLAAEAIVGRIGDAAQKLRDEYGDTLPAEIPWDDVIANRIVVDHIYHRVSPKTLWRTLADDIPILSTAMVAWAERANITAER